MRVAGVALVVLLLVGVSGTVAALTVGPLRPGAGHDAPRYVEETATAGLVQTYGGDDTYDAGGGLAVLDCDGDGRPDVYLPGGANPAALYRNESPTGGALRFTRIASPVTDLTAATGAYPIDIDSDGIADLVVLRNGGGSALLRGLGDCRFEAGERRLGDRADARQHDGLQRDLGGRGDAADARVRAVRRAARRRRPGPARTTR